MRPRTTSGTVQAAAPTSGKPTTASHAGAGAGVGADTTSAAAVPRLLLDLQFVAPAHASHKPLLPKSTLTQWLTPVLFADATLTVRVVDEEEARTLNRQYRGKDYATNVLTFAYAETEDDPVSADVILCAPVVAAEALAQQKPLAAHYAHLVIHGMLHAQGYDHEDDAEAEEMEAIETEAMQRLGFADPYAESGSESRVDRSARHG